MHRLASNTALAFPDHCEAVNVASLSDSREHRSRLLPTVPCLQPPQNLALHGHMHSTQLTRFHAEVLATRPPTLTLAEACKRGWACALQREIEKVRKRREDRELEKAQMEEEQAMLARERAYAENLESMGKEEEVRPLL